MIEKILEISNIGHFVNFKFKGSQNWNGDLHKLNIIYAPNGSGKTTLSTIFKSISENETDLIKFKKTIGTTENPVVKIKTSRSGLITLEDSKWTRNNLEIEVFDINYIEDYLFAGSYARKQNKTNLFKLLFGQKGNELRDKMRPLINQKDALTKALSKDKKNKTILENLNVVKLKLDPLLREFVDFTQPIYEKHIELVNKYLEKFTSYITLSSFTYLKNTSDFERFRIFLVFEVYEEQVIFETPNLHSKLGNAKYSMSEGDKSTVALCFFLARLEYLNITNKIIVFDDPLSSFDYSRRNTTIFNLAKIANECSQFFLLTHDLAFATDFSDKCSFIDQIQLKIDKGSTGSEIKIHNFNSEFLTVTQKDIEIIKSYLISGADTEAEKREVIRCIRPALEGVFKSKYFDIIPNNIWLGDIIELIKKSPAQHRLYKLNRIIDNVIELNDYTKNYHHSSGNNRNLPIDKEELKRYIDLLMKTIDEI